MPPFVRRVPTPTFGSVVRCANDGGCILYPPFALDRAPRRFADIFPFEYPEWFMPPRLVNQGDVRRASRLVPRDAEFIVLRGPIPVPNDINAPIRTVSVWPGVPRVCDVGQPCPGLYYVRYSGLLIDTRSGTRTRVANVEGYVDAAHVQYVRDLPRGVQVSGLIGSRARRINWSAR
jgi:hypothetical protein